MIGFALVYDLPFAVRVGLNGSTLPCLILGTNPCPLILLTQGDKFQNKIGSLLLKASQVIPNGIEQNGQFIHVPHLEPILVFLDASVRLRGSDVWVDTDLSAYTLTTENDSLVRVADMQFRANAERFTVLAPIILDLESQVSLAVDNAGEPSDFFTSCLRIADCYILGIVAK